MCFSNDTIITRKYKSSRKRNHKENEVKYYSRSVFGEETTLWYVLTSIFAFFKTELTILIKQEIM